jgi:hypothetical protein
MILNKMFNKNIKEIDETKSTEETKLNVLKIVQSKENYRKKFLHSDVRDKIEKKGKEILLSDYFNFHKNALKLGKEKKKLSVYSGEFNNLQTICVKESNKEKFPSISVVNSNENLIQSAKKSKAEYSYIKCNSTISENLKKSHIFSAEFSPKYVSSILTLENTQNENVVSKYSLKLIKSESESFSKKINLKDKNFIVNIQNNKKIPLLYNSINLVPKKSTSYFSKLEQNKTLHMNTISNLNGKAVKIFGERKKSKKMSINILSLLK